MTAPALAKVMRRVIRRHGLAAVLDADLLEEAADPGV
jgi:hypothetical protein